MNLSRNDEPLPASGRTPHHPAAPPFQSAQLPGPTHTYLTRNVSRSWSGIQVGFLPRLDLVCPVAVFRRHRVAHASRPERSHDPLWRRNQSVRVASQRGRRLSSPARAQCGAATNFTVGYFRGERSTPFPKRRSAWGLALHSGRKHLQHNDRPVELATGLDAYCFLSRGVSSNGQFDMHQLNGYAPEVGYPYRAIAGSCKVAGERRWRGGAGH